MATDNNIKHFTAADIEKYHQGLLSNKAMHDLEKAAMDDPFLADALEGYTVAGVNVDIDIAELKKRLAEKTVSAKVVKMNTAPGKSFRTLRAAILLAFVAGASLLIYQFGFNKKSEQLASAETTNKEDKKIIDSSKNTKPETANITTNSAPSSDSVIESPNKGLTNKDAWASLRDQESSPGTTTYLIKDSPIVTGSLSVDDKLVNKPLAKQEIAAAPPKFDDKRSDHNKITEKAAEKKELAKVQAGNQPDLKSKKDDADGSGIVSNNAGQKNYRKAELPQKANQQVYNYQSTNLFRGRVTDADNRGVPFANVTNVQDNNAGTYTDANGNFNLIYPDTVLSVQVRSIGFDNTNVQLRNTIDNNHIVMQEDRKSLSELVISNQKPIVTNRSRAANIKLEEPEPADGWENYDTYIANNLELPEEEKTKQAGKGAVEISFEVNKNGEPTNIKIEKSLCPKCDEEAKRLIKEGPKWKRSAAKKGKTTVTISF